MSAWEEHTELAVFAMWFNMTLPMVLWMRYRGHTWERCGEMAVAMLVSALAALALFWAGVIPGGAALGLQMALMVPAMVAAVLVRLDEYAKPHGVKDAGLPRRPRTA